YIRLFLSMNFYCVSDRKCPLIQNSISSMILNKQTSLNVKNSKASKEATKQSSGEPSKKDIKQPAGKASKESVQKNSTETVKKHSQESPNEAGESAGTRKKGFGRFAKVVLAVTVLSTTAYGGAVYYSLRDDKFRRHFTSSIHGADRAVGYVET